IYSINGDSPCTYNDCSNSITCMVDSKLELGIFTLIGLSLINNLDYWPETIQTLSLVLISVVIAMIIGIPVGMWMSQNKTVQSIITSILDFMQTMPAFVYLIPSVVFFGIGMTPGIIATIIFSMPPT